MNETGWQAIGRIAKERRERLGLNQNELVHYGGPRVATVGKFERAAQANFPARTQHQIERALGWSRGIVEQVVTSIDEGRLTAEDWEHDLIEEDVPDLADLVDADQLDRISLDVYRTVLGMVSEKNQPKALRAGVMAAFAILTAEQRGEEIDAKFPFPGLKLEGGDGHDHADDRRGAAPIVAPLSEGASRDDLALAADEQGEIAGEQESHNEP